VGNKETAAISQQREKKKGQNILIHKVASATHLASDPAGAETKGKELTKTTKKITQSQGKPRLGPRRRTSFLAEGAARERIRKYGKEKEWLKRDG